MSSGDSSAAGRQSLTGQSVGRYEVLERIGAGGMGVVYKARDRQLGRLAALKFLAAHLVDSPNGRARFLREAQAISALRHPHIAVLYEAGESPFGPFLALEYLEGGTLSGRLARLKSARLEMPLVEALACAEGLIGGLARAHRQGILHRDIKPANLMFDGDGELKITDFGLSKFMAGPEITKPEARLGTPLYMSPEQARGLPLDARSDLFSAAAVIYEMLAGEAPFAAPGEQMVLRRLLEDTPKPLSGFRAGLPAAIEDVVVRALDRDPDRRYARGEDLLAALRAAGETAAAATCTIIVPATPRRPLFRWHPAWSLLAAALLLSPASLPPVRLWLADSFGALPLPAKKSLAVLPFTNIGADAAFCDGLMETLTNKLTQLQQFQDSLSVAPSSEVRKQHVDSPEAARKAFGVNLAITGSVERLGNELRLLVNLVEVRPLRQIRSASVNALPEGLGDLQDRVVDIVAELLELELKPEARKLLAAGGTSNPLAYDLYLQAVGYLRRPDRAGNLDRAIDLLTQARQKAPRYADAVAQRANAYFEKWYASRAPRWLTLAADDARESLAIDPRAPAAHVALGHVLLEQGLARDAVTQFRMALELNKLDTSALHGLAEAYLAQRDYVSAENTYRRAIGFRPEEWFGYIDLGVMYFNLNRFAEAESSFRKVVELTPDNFMGYENLGAIYTSTGRLGQAERMLRKSLSIHEDGGADSNLGTVLYYQGRFAEAVAMNEAAVRAEPGFYQYVGNLADSLRWTPGRRDEAARFFRKAIEMAESSLYLRPDDPVPLSDLAVYRAKLGEHGKARALIRRARKLAPGDSAVELKAALVFAVAGGADETLAALEAAVRAGLPIFQIEREPEFENERNLPRYGEILSRGRAR